MIARSVARIFYRNSINVGLPVLECDIECSDGDTIEVDLENGSISINGLSYLARPFPDFLMEILMDGGLVAHRRKEGDGHEQR